MRAGHGRPQRRRRSGTLGLVLSELSIRRWSTASHHFACRERYTTAADRRREDAASSSAKGIERHWHRSETGHVGHVLLFLLGNLQLELLLLQPETLDLDELDLAFLLLRQHGKVDATVRDGLECRRPEALDQACGVGNIVIVLGRNGGSGNGLLNGIVERCREDVSGHQTLLLSDGDRLIQMHLHLLHLGQHLLLLHGRRRRRLRLTLSIWKRRQRIGDTGFLLLPQPASLGGLLDGMMTLTDLLGATRKETDGQRPQVGILGRVGMEDDGDDISLAVVNLLGTELILEDEPGGSDESKDRCRSGKMLDKSEWYSK